jgi:hypothetical protein
MDPTLLATLLLIALTATAAALPGRERFFIPPKGRPGGADRHGSYTMRNAISTDEAIPTPLKFVQ